MPATIRWRGTITAVTSIAHGGETRGTITLLRREKVVQPDGRIVLVPIISGNSWRGILRRVGEDLLREALNYDGQINLAAAHALRGGGSLVKTTGQALSGDRLRKVRSLLPQVGVFGCAAGGRIIDGCLKVGKLVPYVTDAGHIVAAIGVPGPLLRQFDVTQIESYVRHDDADTHDFPAIESVEEVPVGLDGLPVLTRDDTTSNLMQYRCETYPSGSMFAAWLDLSNATALEAAFFADVLAAWSAAGHLGGRGRAGHGRVTAELHPEILRGQAPPVDWRSHLQTHRAEALEALSLLT